MHGSRIPIRMRLSLWYLASFFVVLVLFSGGMFYAMSRGVEHEFDRDIKIRLAGIGKFLDDESQREPEKIPHELQEHAELRPGGELLQISDESGRWVFQSESMRHLAIRMPAFKAGMRPVFTTVWTRDTPIRLGTAFKLIGSHRYGIQLAQSLEESSELIQVFGWVLLGAAPIVLLVAGVTGYWMARRALQPVINITQDARAISALDISKRIAVSPARDELRNLSTTLNEMIDRLEAAFRRVTQFTADASHELRTPIALIRTTAELAVAERSPAASFEALVSILQESERTTGLLEDLLVMARADSNARVRMETLDVQVPVQQAILQAEVLASSRAVSLQLLPKELLRQEASPGVIEGSPDSLRRLFLILIDNAVKYTPRGGHIVVEVSRRNGAAEIEVRDTGVGISAEDLPHIFERFYRADKVRDRSGGAGLGLSIAEWIIKTHHGSIEVTSVVDGGTTFKVRLPLARSSESAWAERASHSRAPEVLKQRNG